MRTRDSIHRKNSPFYGPERFYLRSGKQSLYLSRGPAAELRWPQSSESRLDLYRDAQTLWSMLAKTTVHQCSLPLPCHSPTRASPTTRPRTSEHGRVRAGTTAEKKSGSIVCGTEASDRAAPLTLATHEVRPKAVLPGSGCAEHQATGAVPRPAATPC